MSMARAGSSVATPMSALAMMTRELCMDERPRVLEILGADRRGTPVGQRRDCTGRVIAGVLGKGASALHEQVWHIPALQIDVERAVAGGRSHDGAAAPMRALVTGHVVGTLARLLPDLLCAHVLEDFGIAVGEIGVHLQLVLMEIHGHTHERPAEAILVSRIEVEIVVAVGVPRGVHARAGIDRAEVVVAHRPFPLRAPGGRAGGHRRRFHRPAIGLHLAQVPAADKPQRTVIEIIAVELVDAHADRARGDEWIEVVFCFVKEADRAGHRLMGEIAPDLASAGTWLIWLAYTGKQQELYIEELERAQQDEVSGLLPLLA